MVIGVSAIKKFVLFQLLCHSAGPRGTVRSVSRKSLSAHLPIVNAQREASSCLCLYAVCEWSLLNGKGRRGRPSSRPVCIARLRMLSHLCAELYGWVVSLLIAYVGAYVTILCCRDSRGCCCCCHTVGWLRDCGKLARPNQHRVAYC